MLNGGGSVAHVNVDGPFKRMVRGMCPELDERGFESYEPAAAALVDYVVAKGERSPGVTPWIITNFPNWGREGKPPITSAAWGDYAEAFEVLVDEFRDRDVPLAVVMVDHPAEYGRKDRIVELQERAAEREIPFNMIVNFRAGGRRSDRAFSEWTLSYVRDLQKRDLDPDRYTVESWYEHPQTNVPETDETTMTGLVRSVLELRKEP